MRIKYYISSFISKNLFMQNIFINKFCYLYRQQDLLRILSLFVKNSFVESTNYFAITN